MELRQLKYFVAVAEERNFGRAAARLHLSQPPLTRQIQMLEDELGTQLFLRTPRGVELTQAGAAFLEDARSIRMLVGQAADRAQKAGRGEVGTLDVGLFGTAMYETLPQLFAQFRARHPQVRLALHHGPTPVQLNALRQRRVVLVFERMVPREDDIAVELVHREPIVLALHEDHPLAALPEVPVEALKDEPMIMPSSPSSQLHNASLELMMLHGVEPCVEEAVADIVTGALLVSIGRGLVMVPQSLRRLQMPGVVLRPLKSRHEVWMELYCYHLKEASSPLLDEMLALVRRFRRAGGMSA